MIICATVHFGWSKVFRTRRIKTLIGNTLSGQSFANNPDNLAHERLREDETRWGFDFPGSPSHLLGFALQALGQDCIYCTR